MNQYGNKKDISVLCSTKYVHRVINYNEEDVAYLKNPYNASSLLWWLIFNKFFYQPLGGWALRQPLQLKKIPPFQNKT